MLTNKFIELEKANLTALSNQLDKEASFAKQFIKNKQRPSNEINWFISVRSICIYGTFLIKNTIDNLENYKVNSEEQIGYYIGKIAIQTFLEIINAFEQSINNLITQSDLFNDILNDRIEKRISIVEKSWKPEVNSKSRGLKKDIIRGFKRKTKEMKFIRDSLRKKGIIDELDFKILEFSWDIRNSMHSNFLAIKKIEFNAPSTNLNYSFKFEEGQELYHPKDLLSFYSMTEQIIFIQLKILQYFNKKEDSD